MVLYKEQMVQRPLHFAVIDEVDSILIDEARTPLIISGQAAKSTKRLVDLAACPEMISGVLASSIKIESTSSITAK